MLMTQLCSLPARHRRYKHPVEVNQTDVSFLDARRFPLGTEADRRYRENLRLLIAELESQIEPRAKEAQNR